MRALILAFAFVVISFMETSCSAYKLCPIPGCQVHLLHAHNGVTFRGQPWWRIKKLNPKVGQYYVFTKKDKNVSKTGSLLNPKKKKTDERKSSQLAGIKARDPGKRKQEKDLEVEEPEEDKEEKVPE